MQSWPNLNDSWIHPAGQRKDTQTLSQSSVDYDRDLKPVPPAYKAWETHTRLRRTAYAKFVLVFFHNILIIPCPTASSERKNIECACYFIMKTCSAASYETPNLLRSSERRNVSQSNSLVIIWLLNCKTPFVRTTNKINSFFLKEPPYTALYLNKLQSVIKQREFSQNSDFPFLFSSALELQVFKESFWKIVKTLKHAGKNQYLFGVRIFILEIYRAWNGNLS
jgi:hypothetical protein